MSFCNYRHIFGKEGEGVHSYRLFNIAIVDTLLTVLAAWIIAYYTKRSFVWVFIGLMILGVLLHRLFCVRTTLTLLTFGEF